MAPSGNVITSRQLPVIKLSGNAAKPELTTLVHSTFTILNSPFKRSAPPLLNLPKIATCNPPKTKRNYTMPAREKRRETTAGIFVLIGLLLLGVLIVEFGRFGDRFSNHYPLYIEFSDTAGIIKGSEVRLRGAKIGSVATKPELITDNAIRSVVRMEIRIRDDIQIPHDSEVKIGSSGIMGDTYIQIVPPEKETGQKGWFPR